MPLFFIYLGVSALSAHYPRTRRRAIRSNFAAQILRTRKTIKVYNNHLFTANYAPLITASIPHATQLRTLLPKNDPKGIAEVSEKIYFCILQKQQHYELYSCSSR